METTVCGFGVEDFGLFFLVECFVFRVSTRVLVVSYQPCGDQVLRYLRLRALNQSFIYC